VHLPAAGLLLGELDIVAEPLQQPHDRPPGGWEQRVAQTRDEEADAHRCGVSPIQATGKPQKGNQSGQTITLGLWAAGAGSFFAFLSAMIGWLGVAVTGSDTSSSALFGALQVTAANDAGMSPTLLAAANSSGGVLGKMISPQNLAIGAAAVGLAGQEGDLFRKVLGWSLLLMILMCGIVYLQSTAVLDWMVVK
jgi:hypothetical protein